MVTCLAQLEFADSVGGDRSPNGSPSAPRETAAEVLALPAAVSAALPAVASPLPARSGSDSRGRLALIRFEDVGPGGRYATLEDLGKLRAVLEYMAEQGIPYQVAVIPRFRTMDQSGSWQEAGIDDPQPTESTQAFIQLLHYMQDHGGTLGVHGYTHQYGDLRRADEQQQSGIGNEFQVPGEPASQSAEYARSRAALGFAAFQTAGLQADFWETPHNEATAEQRAVFRSFHGLQYECLEKRDLEPAYIDNSNTPYAAGIGAVQVPTPLYYIEGGAGSANSVESLLRRLVFFSGLASLFYHPFLEFPFLEPVLSMDGSSPVLQDGLPLYRYRAGSESHLQRLIHGMGKWGYRFVSLGEVVPFVPGSRLALPAAAAEPLPADFDGDGRSELVYRIGESLVLGRISLGTTREQAALDGNPLSLLPLPAGTALLNGDCDGDGRQDLIGYDPRTGSWQVALSRGRDFGPWQNWLSGWAGGGGWTVLAGDLDGDRQADLLVRDPAGGWRLARSDGAQSFVPNPAAIPDPLPGASRFCLADLNGDQIQDLIGYNPDRNLLSYAYTSDGRLLPGGQFALAGIIADGELLGADFNSDGRGDVLLRSPVSGCAAVLLAEGSGLRLLDSPAGPWLAGAPVQAADLDGDGAADLLAHSRSAAALQFDLAKSGLKKKVAYPTKIIPSDDIVHSRE